MPGPASVVRRAAVRRWLGALAFDARREPTRSMRLPSLCAVCRGWGAQRVCADCVQRFAPDRLRCARCALELPASLKRHDETAGAVLPRLCGACLVDPPPFERSLTAVDYDHPWDGLVQRFKFHDALDLAPALVERLLQAHRHSGLPPPALLLPMPISAPRLRERGYNQALELARRLAKALPCAVDTGLLLRIHDRPHQLSLAPDQRTANVRGAFAVEPTRRGELRGRALTLVDDVMTTGASAAEATRVLLQAGAASVDVWTVARTPRPGPR